MLPVLLTQQQQQQQQQQSLAKARMVTLTQEEAVQWVYLLHGCHEGQNT